MRRAAFQAAESAVDAIAVARQTAAGGDLKIDDRPVIAAENKHHVVVRVAAGTIDPAVPLLRDRASFEGDFSLAAKLPEMFGAPSPY